MLYGLRVVGVSLANAASLEMRVRRLAHQRVGKIQGCSSRWADYKERDPASRPLYVCIVGDQAITRREDIANRHAKVLEIARTDLRFVGEIQL